MRFTLRGKVVDLQKRDVDNALKGVNPEPLRKYYVVVNGRQYPPKQALEKALKLKGVPLERVGYTTADAYSILRRLGFKVKRL